MPLNCPEPTPHPQPMEKLSSMKLVPGAKKVEDLLIYKDGVITTKTGRRNIIPKSIPSIPPPFFISQLRMMRPGGVIWFTQDDTARKGKSQTWNEP